MISIKQRGFSLVELMVVCALIGILATLAVSYARPMARHQRFAALVRAVMQTCNKARATALRTGNRAAVTVTPTPNHTQVVAFIDSDSSHGYTAADQVVFSYPSDLTQYIDPTFSVTAINMQTEHGEPQTAFFDSRGFKINPLDGYSEKNANICVTDTVSGEQANIKITLFGYIALIPEPCPTQ